MMKVTLVNLSPHVHLTRLALLCVFSASGSSLWGPVDTEGLDFRACFVFRDCRGLVGRPESRSSAWAARSHPVSEVSLLGKLPLWLGSEGLMCCSEDPLANGVFTLQVVNEVRSSLQL